MEKIYRKVAYDRYLFKPLSDDMYKEVIKNRDWLIENIKTKEELLNYEYDSMMYGENTYRKVLVFLSKTYLTDRKMYEKFK